MTTESTGPLTAEEVEIFANGDLEIEGELFERLCAYYLDEMPYGTAKARDGDPYEWIAHRLYKTYLATV